MSTDTPPPTPTAELAAQADGSLAIESARSKELAAALALLRIVLGAGGPAIIALMWRLAWSVGYRAGLDAAQKILQQTKEQQ